MQSHAFARFNSRSMGTLRESPCFSSHCFLLFRNHWPARCKHRPVLVFVPSLLFAVGDSQFRCGHDGWFILMVLADRSDFPFLLPQRLQSRFLGCAPASRHLPKLTRSPGTGPGSVDIFTDPVITVRVVPGCPPDRPRLPASSQATLPFASPSKALPEGSVFVGTPWISNLRGLRSAWATSCSLETQSRQGTVPSGTGTIIEAFFTFVNQNLHQSFHKQYTPVSTPKVHNVEADPGRGRGRSGRFTTLPKAQKARP